MREYWIDYLRCIGVIGVLGIHVTSPFYNSFSTSDALSWWVANIINASSRFSVPLFIMISGCVLLGRDISVEEFYKKRLKRLFPALFFWSLFYFLFRLHNGESLRIIFSAIVTGHMYYHLWYLSMFICIMIFAPYINKIVIGDTLSRNEITLLVLIIFLFFSINWVAIILKSTTGKNIFWFKLFPLYLAYFIFGYYLKEINQRLKIRNIAILLILSSVIIFGIGLNYVACKYLNIVEDYFVLSNLGGPTLVITSLIFLFFYKNKNILKPHRLILALSDNSFGIYLVHPFFLYYIRRVFPNYSNQGFLSIPLSLILLPALSFVTIHLIRKTTFGRSIC